MPDQGRLSAEDEGAGPLKRCRTRAAEALTRVHRRFEAALDASLKASGEEGSFECCRGELLDELRMLQRNRDKLAGMVQEHFGNGFRDSVAALSGPRSGEAVHGGLTLIHDHEPEEMLAIDRHAARILEGQDHELRALVRRFEQLLGARPLGRNDLPIAPARYFQAYQRAFDGFELGLDARLHAHERLGVIVSDELSGCYADINRLLAERGILPALVIEAENVPASAPATLQDQMFEAMQYLLSAHFSHAGHAVAGGPSGSGDGSATQLPVTPMLIETLSALQHDEELVSRTGELIRGGLKYHVMGRYADGSRSGDSLHRIDDETIDVISMIFDYILDDPLLPGFIKALVGRLQIPVLKVAILDREFFSRKSHPARQLLNELSRAGLGWREEQEASRDRLYQKMEEVVRRILEEFESDTGIFSELLEEFRGFLEEENRGFDEAQHRLLETAQDNERRERIAVEVGREIAARLVDRPVPEDIREFLTVDWREYMTGLALAQSADAGIPAEALDFIDDLVWSLQPKTSAGERKRLVAMLPGLLDRLRRAMAATGRAPERTEPLIASLEQHHFECLRPQRRNSAGDEEVIATELAQTTEDEVDRVLDEISNDMDRLSDIDWNRMMSFDDVMESGTPERQSAFEQMITEMGLETDRDEGPRIEDEFTEQVRALELGTRVELTDGQGDVVRARLVWKGDRYSSFSFMNRQYKIVAERPLYMLADDFRHGRAVVIEHVAPFDRAINGVIAGITRLAGGASH